MPISEEQQFQDTAQRELILAGFVDRKCVGALLAFEAKRLIEEGATEETAPSLALTNLRDGTARKTAIEALRADQPGSFIAPATKGESFFDAYRRVVKRQSSLASGDRTQRRVLESLNKSKARHAARKGGA